MGETGYDQIASVGTRYSDTSGFVDLQEVTIFDEDGNIENELRYLYNYSAAMSSGGADALHQLTVNGEMYEYEYDGFGRVVKRKTSIDADDESKRLTQQVDSGKYEAYTYANGAATGTTTTLVKTFRDMLGVLHTYSYDANGNITSEYIGEGDNKEYKTYLYDSQNRLIRANDSELDMTITYEYDARGNITNYTVYDYTAKDNDLKLSTAVPYNYAYNNSTWKDLATNIHGTAISYDAIGNPLNWTGGANLIWENGRQLKSIILSGAFAQSYTYNGDGLRLSKWGERNTKYIIVDGTYLGERTTIGGVTYDITYIYGGDGSVTGIEINGTPFYFVKNLQGDVTAIITATGDVVAKYAYDAYSRIMSVTSANGTAISAETHIARLNPFRYRGYMYDEETGFYYLRSRYYDPEVGRFLNADDASILTLSEGPSTDKNLFAYCDNNPVNRTDYTGEAWVHWIAATAIVVGFAALTVATCGGSLAVAASAVGMVASGTAAFSTASTIAAAGFIGAGTALAINAIDAVNNSSSADEFADQGGLSTVATTAIGAGAGAYIGSQMAKSISNYEIKTSKKTTGSSKPPLKSVPNSRYIQRDQATGLIRSDTVYDSRGNWYSRVDYMHTHNIRGVDCCPHIHLAPPLNEFGYPIGREMTTKW